MEILIAIKFIKSTARNIAHLAIGAACLLAMIHISSPDTAEYLLSQATLALQN